MSRRRRAVLSVTDKTGLVDLGRRLVEHGYELVASGGTAAHLGEAGLPVTEVAEITGQPEILGGRVKTLHPALHAGILAAREEDLEATAFAPVDLVVVNLYDFAGAVARGGDEAQLVESVDIGGPTLLRAAAKNFDRVTVLCDPSFYGEFVGELERHQGGTCRNFRRRMAGVVMQRTSDYDRAIARQLFVEDGVPSRAHPLRYGENPHQKAWWRVVGGGELADLGLEVHGGKELSYNNIVDLVAALKLGLDLPEDACAVLKHTNPCGVGRGADGVAAFERALLSDPVSAFGGIVVLRRPVDGPTAEKLASLFLEVVAAPGYDEAARERLSRKKNLRWLSVDLGRFAAATRGSERRWGKLELVQDEDEGFAELDRWQHVAGPVPDDAAVEAGRLAWIVAKHVKSNAVVLADASGLVGVGAGQMSRVDSCHLALRKARDAGLEVKGCAAGSDAFFPFPDGLEVLAEAGVSTVVQPGGSIRDEDVVVAAERLGVSLCHTGVRHFRH